MLDLRDELDAAVDYEFAGAQVEGVAGIGAVDKGLGEEVLVNQPPLQVTRRPVLDLIIADAGDREFVESGKPTGEDRGEIVADFKV